MAELESQPLSDEERAELEELRAEKARREAREEARREREELATLRAERARRGGRLERRIRIGARARTQARCCEACACRAQTSA